MAWQPVWQLLVGFNNTAQSDPILFSTIASPPGTLGAVNVWTDITADIRDNLDTNRGRQHEIDRVQSGTMSVTLDNRSGKYDPWSVTSPYAGKILPGRPVRLQATINSFLFYVYTGIADVWATGWTAPNDATVSLSCVDLFSYMNNAPLAVRTYENAVLADSPTGYWTLGDPVGSAGAADSSGNQRTGTYVGTPTLGVAGPFVFDPATAVTFGTPSSPAGYATVPNPLNLGGTLDVTIEAWILATSFPSQVSWIFNQTDINGAVGGVNCGLTVNSTGQTVLYSLYNVAPCVGVRNVCDNKWHHLVGTVNHTTGAMTVYVDGTVDATSSPGTAAVAGSPQFAAIGSPTFAYSPVGAQNYGTVAQVAVYNSLVSSSRILAHYQIGAPVGVEPSGTRVNRVASTWMGLPVGTIDTGKSNVQAATTSLTATNTLSYLQQVEQSEGGLLYIDNAGHVWFKSRDSVYTNTTNQATFGDGGGPEIPFQLGPQIAVDTQDVYGQIVLTRNNGNPQTVVANTGFGIKTYQQSGLLNTTDTEILGYAQWLATQFNTAKPRIRQITVHPVNDPTGTATQAVLSPDIGTVVTVNRHTLPGAGTAFTQICNVEGINWHIYPATGDFNVEFQLTPIFPQRPWMLGTSQLGVDTNLFF
jgi:hypothetical protein